MNERATISIITATYNAADVLPELVASLRAQIDQDFEWVVADGASTDGTLELLRSIKDLNLKIVSQEDFGIYDALNRGVKASSGDYYLVVGADDGLYPEAISIYRESLKENTDFVTASVSFDGHVKAAGRGSAWRVGQFAYFSSHAVGVLIKRALHDKFGFYSRRYPIAADQLFLLAAVKGGATITVSRKVVGYFGTGGLSSYDLLGSITELYRVQVQVGHDVIGQTILCCARLGWYSLKLLRARDRSVAR